MIVRFSSAQPALIAHSLSRKNVRFTLVGMARVSQEHLDARRRQILEGAARCFARHGFHATTMQDVLSETGLSAGAVYRYFPGKEAMIAEIAREVMNAVHDAFERESHAPHPAPPDEIILEKLSRVPTVLGYSPPLVVQVWAEALRNPQLGAIFQTFLDQVIAAWSKIITRYQQRGEMPAELSPEHIARTLIACCQGFMVQRAFGHDDLAWLRDGLRGLMAYRPRAEPQPQPQPQE
jgi:AcrR family transcriptional regulator